MQLTFEDWEHVKRYLLYDRKQKDTKVNVDTLKSRYRIMCRYFEDVEFNRENFVKYLEYLREKGYTTAYCNQFIKMAKHIDRLYKLDQFSDFTLYRKTDKIVEVLTSDEIVDMAETKMSYSRMEDDTNRKYRAIIYVMYYTGARIGEVLTLRWEDIKTDPTPLLIFNQTKVSELRYAPIPVSLYVDLTHLSRFSGYIFSSPRGTPLQRQAVADELKKRAKAVGIKKVVYNHLLRHSFINIMLRGGAKIHEVSRLVGHKTLETTNRHYVHLQIQELNDVLHTYHPALKKHYSLATITKRIRELCTSILDTEKFDLEIVQRNKQVTFQVKELEK